MLPSAHSRNTASIPQRRLPILIKCAILFIPLIFPQILSRIATTPAHASQQQPPADENLPADDLQRLATDRAVIRELQQLTEAIQNNDLPAFRNSLRSLRSAYPGCMTLYQTSNQSEPSFQPLHRTLTLVLANIRSPELQSARDDDEPSASAELRRTLPDSPPAPPTTLLNILHRYNGTPTAQHIHILLARIHLDRGHSTAAKYWLQPLLADIPQSPFTQQARALHDHLTGHNTPTNTRNSPNQSNPTPAPTPAPNQAQLPSPAPTPEQIPAPQSAIHQLPSLPPDSPPLQIQWTRSLPLQGAARRTLQQFTSKSANQPAVPWSAFIPLADENSVFIRHQSLVTAIDRQSGRTRWTRNLHSLTPQSPDDENSRFQFQNNQIQILGMQTNTNTNTDGITWRTADAWQLAMDAERLFILSAVNDDRSQLNREDSLRMRMILGRQDSKPSVIWELSAIDKLSGRRLWTAGGESVEAPFGNALSETWFLSLPVIHGPELFVVTEKDSQISVACLSASDGHLHWQLPINFPEASIHQDFTRKSLAAQLTFHNGILLASATTGWTFAIDTLTQSSLWAQKLAAPSTDDASQTLRNGRVLRNRIFLPGGRTFVGSSPATDRRPEPPLVINDEVLWILPDIPNITVTSLLSGQILRKLPNNDDALVLTATQQHLITASPTELRAWNTADFSQRWKFNYPTRLQIPVGSAVLRGSQVIIPTADGNLQIRDLNSGKLLETLSGLRPVQQLGTLAAHNADLISAGPGYLTLAAHRQPTPRPGEDPLEQAAFLLATNQPQNALQLLDNTPLSLPSAELHRKLQFRVALCLFAQHSSQNQNQNQNQNQADSQHNILARLKQLASSPAELALATWLELEFPLQKPTATPPETRAANVIAALQLPDPVLSVDLPPTTKLLENAQNAAIEDALEPASPAEEFSRTIRTPLKSLLIQQLQLLLNSSDNQNPNQNPNPTILLAQINQLPDHILCSLNHPSLTQSCLSRAATQLEAGPPSETTLHLLFTAAENLQPHALTTANSPNTSNPSTTSNHTQQLQTLEQLFRTASQAVRNDSSRSPFEQQLLTTLLETTARETLQNIATQNNQPLQQPQAPASPAAPQLWQTVADTSWKLIPVSTNGQINNRNIRTLQPAVSSDPVLTLGRWSSHPESGELAATPADHTTQGSWRLRLPSASPQALTFDETLLRCGSVIIHRSQTSISAFSLLDRRWLWTRQVTGSLSLESSQPNPFIDFDPDREGRRLYERERRIAGYTQRWLCLVTEKQLEVIDLLTGQARWHANSQSLSHNSFACKSAILIQTTFRSLNSPTPKTSEIRVHPNTGLPIATPPRSIALDDQQELRLPAKARLSALSSHLITATNNSLVAWDPGAKLDLLKTLEWIDIQSLQTTRKLDLDDFASAQFLDQQNLVVFSQSGKINLINLHSATTQSLEDHPESPVPPNRVGITADSANIYLFQLPDQRSPQIRPSALYNLPVTTARNQLHAIDKATGKLRWNITLKSPLYLILDHSPSPVLLALQIDEENLQQLNNPIPGIALAGLPKIKVLGLAKSNGKLLFNCPIVSQFPVPGLKLNIYSLPPNSDQNQNQNQNPHPNPNHLQLDLHAFGNRVRLIPAPI